MMVLWDALPLFDSGNVRALGVFPQLQIMLTTARQVEIASPSEEICLSTRSAFTPSGFRILNDKLVNGPVKVITAQAPQDLG